MIVVVGLSHKTAPIQIRERAALSPEHLSELHQQLLRGGAVAEAMIVSTCNRVEVFAAGNTNDRATLSGVGGDVERLLSEQVPGIGPHLYRYEGPHAISHLFRVASSLDSLVLGEPQILGQVKEAFERATKLGTVGARLRRVVGHAVRTAKRVRSETSVGAGQVSVPSVAVDLARTIFGDLKGHRAALVGSGQMGETAIKLLVAAGAELLVVGRNEARVKELCAELGGQPRSLDQLQDSLAEVDMVVSTTSARQYVITPAMLEAVRRRRRGRSLFLMDLAVPRDIDPEVGRLDSVFLYNVDDLSKSVSDTLSQREKEAEAAERIVEAEAGSFERSLSAEQATPTIIALRRQFGSVLEAELGRSLKGRLKHLGAGEREALTKMVDAALNKLVHPATRHLRQLASEEDNQAELDQHVEVLRSLFQLNRDEGFRAVGSGPSDRGALLALDESQQVVATESGDDSAKKVS